MSLQTNKPQSRLGRVGRKLWHDRVSYAFLPVSYTHLDVYKRQIRSRGRLPTGRPARAAG